MSIIFPEVMPPQRIKTVPHEAWQHPGFRILMALKGTVEECSLAFHFQLNKQSYEETLQPNNTVSLFKSYLLCFALTICVFYMQI